MILQLKDIQQMESRYRATFINSLAGFRQAILVGTQSTSGVNNLAIFNSLIHIGAHPPLSGLLFRPDTIQRDTLTNILESHQFTLNYIKVGDFEKAHQTSAKYASNISEFEQVGFTPEFKAELIAPFVKEAVVKIAMKFEEKVDLKINNTILIIGSLQSVEISDLSVHGDGFIGLEKDDVLACVGLDAYYKMELLGRMNYAKPDEKPTRIF